MNMETVPEIEVDGQAVRDKHVVLTQNMFRRVVHNAEEIGMKVNSAKTKQICISDSLTFKARGHIYTTNGERIGTDETMKILSFTFGSRPNCSAHVEAVRRSFRGRYWLLIHLGRNGFGEADLLKIYTTMIRPIAEYCAPVHHSMLTDREDEQLERLQSTALRYVFGFGLSYREMREKAGLDTLRARRVVLCDKFANKCIQSDRFAAWFPRHVPGRSTRHQQAFKEEFVRCDQAEK